MVDTSFLPTLSSFDVERVIQLIQRAYTPPNTIGAGPDEVRRLQQELFEVQKRPEAWGLVLPLLDHRDQNIQFFGAHTAQVKIARDWDAFPSEHVEALRDVIVQLTAHSLAIHRPKFILRKLFVSLTSLALKLVPGSPSRWPDWILSCVTTFSGQGASKEDIHDFLAIVAEEISSADLLGSKKLQLQQSLKDAAQMVSDAVQASITSAQAVSSNELRASLRNFQSWLPILMTDLITPVVPLLISILTPSTTDDTPFITAAETLQEVLTKSPLADGAGTRTITEPLLLWLDTVGAQIISMMLASGDVSEVAHALCKLLDELGEHSVMYLAANLASPVTVVGVTPPVLQGISKTRAELVHNYLKVMLTYAGLPGYYGVDEEESEITLSFWYLLQEALWSTDYYVEEGDEEPGERPPLNKEHDAIQIAKAAFIELVKILRRKVAFPPPSVGPAWAKDQVDRFLVYRRDVGDTLINAYYVLRDEMLVYYIQDVTERLAKHQPNDPWQDVEATLHCIMSIQEALDLETTPYLGRIFQADILGRLPSTGHGRVRRTALTLIGAYATWFSVQPASATNTAGLLMSAVSYVVAALTDPSLCLQAASALGNLCDANRRALAPQIAAFAELHAGLERIPDSEKSKVLQSIASVIEALPPEDEIPPITAIVNPIVVRLTEALRSVATDPDESRTSAILQLGILSGVAKGLTGTTDTTLEENPGHQAELQRIHAARENPQLVKLREDTYAAIRRVMELWSTDAEVGQAMSDLFKSITSLPSDATLISLDPGPMIELVCFAAQRQLTGTWLSLFAILTAQLNAPPPSISSPIKLGPTPESELIMRNALPVILQCSLSAMGQPGAMGANPDIVQEFFAAMDRVAHDFTASFYSLPDGALTTLLQCTTTSLALQERYSLVAACQFLGTFLNRSSVQEELRAGKDQLLNVHGQAITRAILFGFAGVAPRTAMNNLVDLLGTIVMRSDVSLTARWVNAALFADDFVESKATQQTKETFSRAILGTRSMKKIREAAHQFMLVSRGLEGTSFGYASITM